MSSLKRLRIRGLVHRCTFGHQIALFLVEKKEKEREGVKTIKIPPEEGEFDDQTFFDVQNPANKGFQAGHQKILDAQARSLMTNPRPEPRTQFVHKTWQTVTDLELL